MVSDYYENKDKSTTYTKKLKINHSSYIVVLNLNSNDCNSKFKSRSSTLEGQKVLLLKVGEKLRNQNRKMKCGLRPLLQIQYDPDKDVCNKNLDIGKLLCGNSIWLQKCMYFSYYKINYNKKLVIINFFSVYWSKSKIQSAIIKKLLSAWNLLFVVQFSLQAFFFLLISFETFFFCWGFL